MDFNPTMRSTPNGFNLCNDPINLIVGGGMSKYGRQFFRKFRTQGQQDKASCNLCVYIKFI